MLNSINSINSMYQDAQFEKNEIESDNFEELTIFYRKENNLMKKFPTVKELMNYLEQHIIGTFNGFCFKNTKFNWDHDDPNEIIYVPEYAFEDFRNVYSFEDLMDIVFTKNDFIRIAGERAKELFLYCDWQFPSSALPEIDYDENDEENEG